MKIPVYLDYNATTPIDLEVVNEMLPYIHTNFGNPSSSYSIGRSNSEAITHARNQVARLINAKPEEIIFTSGGTESNNHAIQGIAYASRNKGKHIITSVIEHPAVIEVCRHLNSQGYQITYVPVDSNGMVNPDEIANAIQPGTILISIMHANNEVGTIQPIKEIAAIAQQRNIVFHTDAAQSIGKIDTDVRMPGVNLLSIAGHKLYAPKGIGALYIKQGTTVGNLIYGAGQERGFRPGTENVIHIVGLGKACELAKGALEKHRSNMILMRDRLLHGLKNTLGELVKINGDIENCLPNTLSIAFKGIDAHTLAALISRDLLISVGSACHSARAEISPVLKAMNVNFMTAASTVRISTGKGTTADEIDFAISVLTAAVKRLQ